MDAEPTIVEVTEGRSDLCREVLDDLPDWFGLPDATARYVEAAADLPMLVCRIGGDRAGFVSLRVHTDFAAEIHVIGVKRRHHRRGAGRALGGAAARYCAARGLALPDGQDAGVVPSQPALRGDAAVLRGPGLRADRGPADAVGRGEPLPPHAETAVDAARWGASPFGSVITASASSAAGP